ncbi:DUF3253 domain-containing protein [Caenispirillum bisanense]|uniref:DUF3253 domain-containing protein n=1 Tax=Caenispirillum bisanense TaxID=414052 RepID=UPI0031E22FEF
MSSADETRPKRDPLADHILALCGEKSSIRPEDAARSYFAMHRRPKDRDEDWRRYMVPVKQQMVALARQGLVEITRKGEAQDPDDFKGLVRIRLPLGERPATGEDGEDDAED